MKTNTKTEVTFTEDDAAAYNRAWGQMPYGSSITINRQLTSKAIIDNLRALAEFLKSHAEHDTEQEKEFTKIKASLRGAGELFKLLQNGL